MPHERLASGETLGILGMLAAQSAVGESGFMETFRDGRLRGRENERLALNRLLADVMAGVSRALVIRGEPGIGKTALLDDFERRADQETILRIAGVEAENELPFAALHRLCVSELGRADRLPTPQRAALEVALGVSSGAAPDRFIVGLAILNLLVDASEEHPLVCIIDDAQWLDRVSGQTLGFVARRLRAEPIGLVFAVRDPVDELRGLPELALEGLAPDDARELIGSALSVPLDDAVRERFIAEARGNPLALLELPRALTPGQLAGGFGLSRWSVSSAVERSFRRRIVELPPDTQLLLLLAAAEPVGDPALLWRAAALLAVGPDAAVPAEADGLLTIGVRVVFRHPLVRSAVYSVGAIEQRQDVHRALAEATDARVDPDRRAWHRAQAAVGPDEDVAAELEQSADRAKSRGGLAAAAAFLERAVALTPDPGRCADRALAAAQAKLGAGDLEGATALVSVAERGRLDDLQRARADLLQAQTAFMANRGRDVPPLLLQAARRLESLDADFARDTYLDCMSATLWSGRLSSRVGVLEVARAARAAPPATTSGRPTDLLLDGLATTITDGYSVGAPMLKRALRFTQDRDVPLYEGLPRHWAYYHAACALWDVEAAKVLAVRHTKLAREVGALTVLPNALGSLCAAVGAGGDLARASALADQAVAINANLAPYTTLVVAAWRGQGQVVAKIVSDNLERVIERGEGMGVAFIEWSTSYLYNSQGRYEQALAAISESLDHPEELWGNGILQEAIEAAARSGATDVARQTLDELTEKASAADTPWALAALERSRALLAAGTTAEGHYRAAIDLFASVRLRLELARVHLLYGEWLRREGRRADARAQLRLAHDMFIAFGSEAYAARAGHELAATGERLRKRRPEAVDELTPQERHVAMLARDGYTNREIGAQLFISHKTVGYHLHKVFAKLDVTSRTQLHAALDSADPPATAGAAGLAGAAKAGERRL